MPCKLPSDPPDHPHGQWSLVIELKERVHGYDRAEVRFLVEAAPHAELKPGAMIELREGPRRVGDVEILP
jgi:hypothetical protein